jgi:protein tyrosine phosphatase
MATAVGAEDFDLEAEKLFARLGVTATGQNYNNCDAIWSHPVTGAKVYIGNKNASSSREILTSCSISHVVNCTDNLPNCFETSPGFTYFRFNISYWFRAIGSRSLDAKNAKAVLDFFQPVFDFIEVATANGDGVLIHCLAGAHRAGTTGIAFLMHIASLNREDATRVAKRLRPIVDPICSFKQLLTMLDSAQFAQK